MLTTSFTNKKSKILFVYPVIVISLAACFLFYKYVLQIFPSIITEQLMQQFQLTGTGLGNLAATFYYSYMVTQLFVGVLLDKYSTRYFTTGAIFCCAIGVLLFSKAETIYLASFARALMGIGVAFATVSYMKLTADWFSAKQYAFVSGLLATAAMSGAVFGQAPLSWFIGSYSWRPCLFYVGIVGICLSILFYLIVRDASRTAPSENTTGSFTFSDVKLVLNSKRNWILTIYSGLAFSPVAVFGGLWGNPFLEQAYHLSKTQAASMISLVFVGLGLGSPILGLISDRLGNRQLVMLIGTACSTVAITSVLYLHSMPIEMLSALLFVFGFGLGAFMLVFAMGKEMNPLTLTATVIAMINTSDAVFDAITEPLIGRLLDMSWDGNIVNGVHQFSLASYQSALTILPVYLCLGAILLFWIREPKTYQ